MYEGFIQFETMQKIIYLFILLIKHLKSSFHILQFEEIKKTVKLRKLVILTEII